jgi:hypothetical protein
VTATDEGPPALPLDAAGDRPTFFKEAGVDQLLSMVLELAAELWVVRERVYRLEAAAGSKGLDLTTLVESLELSRDQAAQLADLRERFTRGLFRSLNRPTGDNAPESLSMGDL